MKKDDYLKFMGFTPVEDYTVLSAEEVKPILEIQGHQNHVFAIRDAKGVALFSKNHKIVSVDYIKKNNIVIPDPTEEKLEIKEVKSKLEPVAPTDAFESAEDFSITQRKTNLKGLGFVFKAEEQQYVRGGIGISVAHVEKINDAEWLATYAGLKNNIEKSNDVGKTTPPMPQVPVSAPAPPPMPPVAPKPEPVKESVEAPVIADDVNDDVADDTAEDFLSDMCVARIEKLVELGWIDNGTRLLKGEESLEYESIENMSNDIWDKYMLVPEIKAPEVTEKIMKALKEQIVKASGVPEHNIIVGSPKPLDTSVLVEDNKEVSGSDLDIEKTAEEASVGKVGNGKSRDLHKNSFTTIEDYVDYYLGTVPRDINCTSWYDMRTEMINEFKAFIIYETK
jgi:hypothetical protein